MKGEEGEEDAKVGGVNVGGTGGREVECVGHGHGGVGEGEEGSDQNQPYPC